MADEPLIIRGSGFQARRGLDEYRFQQDPVLKTKGECDEMPDEEISSEYCPAMRPGIDGAFPGAEPHANDAFASRAELRYCDRPNHAGA